MPSEPVKCVPKQDDVWDAALAKMPPMMCGRLDMNTYDGATGEPQRFVYVEGVEERTLVQGPYCDEIAYAAQRYTAMQSRIDAAEARATSAEERCKRLREALEWYASDEPYGVTCAHECGVPTEIPHLVIEEDRGARARTALAREGEKAKEDRT